MKKPKTEKLRTNLDTHSHSNDPKLSDGGGRRGTCIVGGNVVAEAGAVTHGGR